MTIKQIQITLAALFLIFGTAVAGAKELIIDSAFTESSLGPYLSYHLDTTDALTIDQISSEDRGVRFRPLSSDNPSLGYMIHPLWVALTVINRKNAPERAILEYNYPIIDDVTLFIPQKNGFIEKKGGDHYPASIKEIPYRTIAFPVTIDPGKLTCYLKIKTSGSMTVALKLYVREQFRNMQVIEMTLLGLFYGLMISLIMYNILIFFAMKEISFLYLSLFSLFLSLYSCVHTGIAFQYLWPSHVTFANASHPMFLIFTISMAIQFTRSYLDTGNSLPSIDPFLRVTMLFGLAAGFLSLVIKYHIMTQFSTLYSLIGIVVVLILGSVLFFRGKREAVFYLIAWIFIFIGGILSAGRAFGVIPETPISNWTYQIGSPILIMLLSLGVSDKLNTMKRALDRALAALKESEEKYKTVVDNAHDGILVIIDEKPIYANKNLVAMLGYDEKTIRSRYFYDLFPETPTGKELVIRMYKERMVGRDVPSRYESQMLTADGTIIDTMIAAAHAVINGKKGSICLISDITEQKKSQKIIMEQFEKIQVQYNRLEELNSELTATHEQLIQANESITIEKEQLAATLSSIGDAVIVYNAEGIITMVNPNAAVLTGWAIEEAVGKKAGDVVMLTDSHARKLIFEDYPRQYDPRGLDTIGIPFDMRDRNGSEKIIEINGTHIRKEHSQTGGVVLAIRDITGKVRLEKEILNMSKMESLGVLAGGIAHDFNNLLTAILGNVSMARSLGSLEGRIAELFDKIEQAVKRSISLTHQLLTFSKGGEPIKKTVYLPDVIKESATLILSGSKVKPEYDIDNGLYQVYADQGQISQVFNNIIINAMQAMPAGGFLTIKARNVDDIQDIAPLPGGKYIAVSFSDQGIGIHRDNLNRIFDPYFTTKQGGTGLGLASSYSIIKKHNGYLDVSSTVGTGSTFSVYLPASDAGEIDREPESSERPGGTGRILVLDDEEIILDVAVSMLKYLGYTPDTAADGREAIRKYTGGLEQGEPYDAVIMDLTIPGGMGGREALVELLKIDPAVTAIVSSGYSEDPVMARYEKYGFTGILLKPYKLQDISAILDASLKKKKRGD